MLEILSVCCYYSEKTACVVLQGMRTCARFHQEAPFGALCMALSTQDIEMKAAIMQFINNLVMGIADTNTRLIVRSELKSQLFDEKLDDTIKQVDKELSILPQISEEAAGSSATAKLRRRSMTTMYGAKAYDERKVDAMVRQMSSNEQANFNAFVSETGSIAGTHIEIKSKNMSVFVNPLAGTMAGMMHAAKNADKMESKFLDMVGGKKTKRRWYELDNGLFKWCAGHDKEADYKGSVSVSTIIDIRNYTTDPFVSTATPHCFEFETNERIYALACETPEEKDNWLTALQKARDDYIMTKGSYKLQSRELSSADIFKHLEMFKKQCAVYHSISIEDRKNLLDSVGIDLTSLNDVGRYLTHESVAGGVGGKLLSILYHLLLLPPGAHGVWDAIILGLDKLKEQTNRTKEGGVAVFASKGVGELFAQKILEGGGNYNQASKLALSLMTQEKEMEALRQQVKVLEKRLEKMTLEGVTLAGSGNGSRAGEEGDAGKTENPISARVTSKSFKNLRRSIHSRSMGTAAGAPLRTPGGAVGEGGVVRSTVDESNGEFDRSSSMTAVSQSGEGSFAASLLTLASTPAPTTSAPAASTERYAKYDKMRKMLPEGAVRQKMMVDGFSETEIEAYFNEEIGGSTRGEGAPISPPLSSAPSMDERFARYERMRKMLPEGAVRQKMMVDGFSESEIET
ncbi:hypothetical protein EON65_39375, partial [archaeon]